MRGSTDPTMRAVRPRRQARFSPRIRFPESPVPHRAAALDALETDIAKADREAVIRNFISGQYERAVRVVAFNPAEGWSRDVSEDIAGEVLERAFDADDNLPEDTKRFIDRHVTAGEKRPRAPSVRRDSIQPAQKKQA